MRSSVKTPLNILSQTSRRYSLRTRLLLAFLIITFLAVLSVSLASMFVTRLSVRDTLNEHVFNSNRAHGELIEHWIIDRLQVLYVVSNNGIIQQQLQENLNSYPNNPQLIPTFLQQQEERWLTDQDFAQSLTSNPSAQQLRRFYPQNASVMLVDRSGALIAAVQPSQTFDFSNVSWWQAAYAGGQGLLYIQKPFINQYDIPAITVVNPIFNEDKVLLGFLYIEYELNSLANELENLRFGETGGYSLIIANEQLLNGQGVLREVNQNFSFVFNVDINQGTDIQEVKGDTDTWIISHVAISSDDIHLLYDIDHPSLQSGQTFIPVSKDQPFITARTYREAISLLNWRLVLYQKAQEAYEIIDRAVLSNLFMGGLALILATVLAYIISRSISAPIQQLTDTVQQIAQGDLSQRAQLQSSHDEIAQLGHDINSMADTLEQRIVAEQQAQAEARALQIQTAQQQQELEDTVGTFLTFVERVAQGNLEQRLSIPEHPQLASLAQSLNGMVSSLNQITSQVLQATDALAAASTEILAATAQQATSATEQSAAISRTAFTIEQVKTIALQTAERADQLANETQSTLNLAHQGTNVVEETIQAMRLLRTRVESIATTILALAEQTQAVSTIVALVGELADQSNLLALNAAIEAARAGEHGKSFAVVAQHVRALAEQSKAATLRIKEILGEIQKSAQTAVLVTEEGTKGAEVGSRLVTQAGDFIHRIAEAVEHGSADNLHIAKAAQQQTLGVDQIDQAMANIQQTTVQALASTRQAEQAVHDLHVLSQSLQQVVRVFQQHLRQK